MLPRGISTLMKLPSYLKRLVSEAADKDMIKPMSGISSMTMRPSPKVKEQGLREYFKTGDVSKIPDPLVRYFNPEVNRNDNGDGIPGFNANEMIVKGKTVAEMFTRQLPKSDQNPNNIFVQNDLTHQVLTGQITQAEAVKLLNNQISTNNLKARQSFKSR